MTNQIFNPKRFLTYSKYALLVEWKKRILITSIMIVGYIAFVIFFITDDANSSQSNFLTIMTASMAHFIIMSKAFSAFKKKESTMHFLTIPSSNLEKFTFEVGSRIIALYVLAPAFMIVIGNATVNTYAYIEALRGNLTTPIEYNLFSSEIFKSIETSTVIKIIIAISTMTIAGTAAFAINAQQKTMLFIGVIPVTILIIFYSLPNKIKNTILHQDFGLSPDGMHTLGTIGLVIFCVWGLAYAYFKQKEKEV